MWQVTLRAGSPSVRKITLRVVLALAMSSHLACFDFISNDDEDPDDNQFREEVILCEDAVARLRGCCPSFDAGAIECRRHYAESTGCGTWPQSHTDPAFTEAESRCIESTSCDALVANGVCERAVKAGVARTTTVTTAPIDPDTGISPGVTTVGPPTRDGVCP